MNKLLLLIVTLIIISTSAYAADWNFYGSARIQTFVTKIDDGFFGNSYTEYDQYLQANSRIGARIKVNDQLTARFEYGTGVDLRILYGEWNFGTGSFLVGQTYSPLNMFYSNQVWLQDLNLDGVGGLYSWRNPMLRLKFGEFQIALIQPSKTSIFGSSAEVKIPKIEAKYKFSKENWHLQIAGGYNSFETFSGGVTYRIDSYVVALGGGLTFGKAYIQGSIWFGQNVGEYGLLDTTFSYSLFGQDTDSYAYQLVAGYKINDMFSIEAGLGYVEADVEYLSLGKDSSAAYYLQSVIVLAPGVSIIPEIGLIDLQTFFGDDEGDIVYYGMKWQIDF